VLLAAKSKAAVRPGANELAEMWRAAAALERLDVKNKIALGDALLKQLRQSPAPTFAFWSLTRLGARELLHGPLNGVVHPETVCNWLDEILGFSPTHQGERMAWGFCLAQMTRRSGQRALDIDDAHRKRVLDALRGAGVPGAWLRMVEEVSNRDRAERAQFFGDSLPVGLRIRN